MQLIGIYNRKTGDKVDRKFVNLFFDHRSSGVRVQKSNGLVVYEPKKSQNATEESIIWETEQHRVYFKRLNDHLIDD